MTRIIDNDDDRFVPTPAVKAPLDTAFDLDEEFLEDFYRNMNEEED